MAFVSKELKATVHAKLKTIIPKTWKWSLAVRNHSQLVLTVSKAPVDLVALNNGRNELNVYHFVEHLAKAPAEIKTLIIDIIAALNTDNYNRSDYMSDYFDVGHYISLQFGKWDKPFIVAD